MNCLVRFIFLLVLLVRGIPAIGAVSPPVLWLEKGSEAESVSPALSYWRDATGGLSLAQVQSLSPDLWKPAQGEIPSFGYTADTLWLKFTVGVLETTPAREWQLELASTRFDEVDWFVLANGNLITHAESGNLRPWKPGPRYPAIPLRLEPGQQVEIFLRLKTEMSIFTPLTLWSPAAYSQVVERRSWWGALFFGYGVAMASLGLILAGLVRTRGFLLCYSLMMAMLGLWLFCLNGYWSWLGLPASSFFSRYGVLILNGVGSLSVVLFIRHLFDFPNRWPKVERAWKIGAGIILCWMLVAPFGPYRPQIIAVQALESLGSLAGLLFSFYLMVKGLKSARWVFASLLGLWIWSPILYLKFLGVIPMQITMETLVQVTIVLIGILFLGATVDRIREIRRESAESVRRELELRAEMQRQLEQEVRDRTEDFRQAKEAAEAANRFKSLFLANISHEIRAPLSTLVGLSQAMWMQSEQHRLPEEFSRFLNQIRSGGQYLNLILTNLLDVSAAEAGRVPLHRQQIDLKVWLESVRNLLEPIATNHGVELLWEMNMDAAATPEKIETDPVRLTQILLNIAHNALKFTPRGRRVGVEVLCQGRDIQLTVWDEGPGIPPEEAKRIFSAFSQTAVRAPLNDTGVGLGLYVVKLNVNLLGGNVTVTPREPYGTIFVVTLPGRETG